MNIIKSVVRGSIADEIGLEKGDKIISINNKVLADVLDYRYLCSGGEYELEIEKCNGDIEIIEVINDDYEELGAEFENGLLDDPKRCKNKCIFCFVDQLPHGMRKSLYFKDDDYRLSVLMGNYITLTNLTEDDVNRIISMRLPRINVSVHTTDAELRRRMLGNPRCDVMEIIKRFADAGINMNCQVVLCSGINDGNVLNNTINELVKMYPYVQSIAVVPVGLTKHRDNLYQLKKFDEKSAQEVISQIEGYQKQFLNSIGTRFVFASDEFYVTAKADIPDYESYEDFLQIENGVGLLAWFIDEFESVFNKIECNPISVVTGVSAYKYIAELAQKVSDKINIIPVKNDFFGELVTVTGLITGRDIIKQLKGIPLGDKLLISSVMLNTDGLFLDDLTVADIERELNIPVVVVGNSGIDFFKAL